MANGRPRQTKRLEFHRLLQTIPGVRAVYFQRPPTNQMEYDCILYKVERPNVVYADNGRYMYGTYYTVTFIHRDPDAEAFEKIMELPYTSFDRQYMADDLYHDVFTIFYK